MREVTAFCWVPDFARGFVRDIRVRWALEEAGLPYKEHLIDHEEKLAPAYRRLQPFGQVPVYRDGKVSMFESGAIVMKIAEQSEALMPPDEHGRARTLSWAFAAVNSVEPLVSNVIDTELFCADENWAPGYLVAARNSLSVRLECLSVWMQERACLEDRFTAGDLLMTTILRELIGNPVFEPFPDLKAYTDRCSARPAFQRALTAQLTTFDAHVPAV